MFGAETMRLLREKWKSSWGLAQEMYAILQDDVPFEHSGPMTLTQKEGSTQPPLTIRTFGDGVPALRFVSNNNGVVVGAFTLDNGVMELSGSARKSELCRCPNKPVTPLIIWPGSANEILGGRRLDADILNAFALDPRTIDDLVPTVVPGTFVYTPPSGTVLTGNTGPTLHTVFTPANTALYTTAAADLTINVDTIIEQFLGATPAVELDQILLVKITIPTGAFDVEPASTTVSVTDSLGNAYVQIGGYQNVWAMSTGPSPKPALKQTISLWYAVVTTAGVATITVTPSVGAPRAADRPTVITRAREAGEALDAVATNRAAIDTDPEIIETTNISSSAADGELDLFVGHSAFVDAQSILAGQITFLSRVDHDAQNLTSEVSGSVTTPVSTYIAIGASFRQKQSP